MAFADDEQAYYFHNLQVLIFWQLKVIRHLKFGIP